MGFNWLSVGLEVARLLISAAFTLVLGAYAFRKYFAPDIVSSLEEAQKTITNLAKLGGLKSQEFTDEKNLEKIVARDYIAEKIPELEAARLVLSPDTWEQIEEAIERNPAAVLSLWEKWKPYFIQEEGKTAENFDFR